MNKIHIGYHKTGTTFLQKLIFPNVKNYKGRIYNSGQHADHNFQRFKGQNPVKSCENIIKHFSHQNGIFISCEWFTKIRHRELFRILNDRWSVLVMSRNIEDIIESRRSHPAPDFFLNDKIQKNIVDREVVDFYDPDNYRIGIKNLTIVSYEKLFSGDRKTLKVVSNYLGSDISDVFYKNVHRKINSRSKN